MIENTRSSMKLVTNVLIKIDWIEQGLDSSEGSLNGVNVHDRLNKWILFWSNPKLHSMEHSLTLFLDEAYLEHRMNQSSGEKLPWKLSRLRKWQSARGILLIILEHVSSKDRPQQHRHTIMVTSRCFPHRWQKIEMNPHLS